jgi:hypothetical protein
MNTNTLVLASNLSDHDLLAHLVRLASAEREASAELVAHLAALELRPSVYAALGYGSLFDYCTGALRLSEDAACSRIAVARAGRRFPAILDALASGDVSLTSVRLLAPHLTPENHRDVLGRASGRRRPEIEALVAELAPRPDVPTSVRKLPAPFPILTPSAPTALPPAPVESSPAVPPPAVPFPAVPPPVVPSPVVPSAAVPSPPASSPRVLAPPTHRPIVQPTSPERYRVQFTMGKESHDKLRRVQDLLRREIPSGDAGLIFERALDLLLEKVEKAKLGVPSKAAVTPPKAAPSRSIRPETDRPSAQPARRSRYRPRNVDRAAWTRDEGQCGFVSKDGRRCTERAFLEFHHIQPFALGGPATVENISLRCRRHNQYEAELVFGRELDRVRS